jgi:hypothetical protein
MLFFLLLLLRNFIDMGITAQINPKVCKDLNILRIDGKFNKNTTATQNIDRVRKCLRIDSIFTSSNIKV